MDKADTHKFKEVVKGFGADLVGVADVTTLSGINTLPEDLLSPYTRAVSIAVQLPIAVFAMIHDRPTRMYAAVYQTANRLLDDIAFKTARHLQQKGFLSLPIPASQVLDKNKWFGAISHKAVGIAAGLGWQGKNLLLITPSCGSRVRLVSVLTTADLVADQQLKNRCGKCNACRDACPVEAIKGVNTVNHYASRNEALYFDRCLEKLTGEFAGLSGIEAPICGICIKVCPFGSKPAARDYKTRGGQK
jgi:epoxyqueuosine reductase QueG